MADYIDDNCNNDDDDDTSEIEELMKQKYIHLRESLYSKFEAEGNFSPRPGSETLIARVAFFYAYDILKAEIYELKEYILTLESRMEKKQSPMIKSLEDNIKKRIQWQTT